MIIVSIILGILLIIGGFSSMAAPAEDAEIRTEKSLKSSDFRDF